MADALRPLQLAVATSPGRRPPGTKTLHEGEGNSVPIGAPARVTSRVGPPGKAQLAADMNSTDPSEGFAAPTAAGAPWASNSNVTGLSPQAEAGASTRLAAAVRMVSTRRTRDGKRYLAANLTRAAPRR